jgi:hypothetical protein
VDGSRRVCVARARRLTHALIGAAGFVAAAISSAVWLEGCAAPALARGAASSAAPAAVSTAAVSHDFGTLVPAPFGTAFKDVPVHLTEVLVFHQPDAARTSDDADCFRPDGVVSFLGRAATDHLLCFDHDRLKSIEASVVVPATEAPALFAAACADWRRGEAAAALEPDACEGRQGDIAFSARRTDGPDDALATVSITLAAVPPQ